MPANATPPASHLDTPTPLLGGLSPSRFMRRHWQRRPLLIRQALPSVAPPLSPAQLFTLATREDVESRLIRHEDARWSLRHGPLPRRALPPLSRAGWTLLVQGVDLHDDRAHALLHLFGFVPAARLDDLMISYASHGGGVGPHADSYDVFLLQVQGRRRWRIAPPGDQRLVPGVPLKILQNFHPEQEWLLEPGDMLYLPPGWGHDGIAEGACMTCSIGFRAPRRDELAREVIARALEPADDAGQAPEAPLYRDAGQAATPTPGAVPAAMQAYATEAVRRSLADPAALARALGEYLSEPKAQVWFEADDGPGWQDAADTAWLVLDRRSRMLYDDRHVFLNGESYRAGGRDARLMRCWADTGGLPVRQARGLSPQAQALVQDWLDDGWVRLADTPPGAA